MFSPCQFAGYLSMLRLVGTDQSAGVFWEISGGLNKGGWRVKTVSMWGHGMWLLMGKVASLGNCQALRVQWQVPPRKLQLSSNLVWSKRNWLTCRIHISCELVHKTSVCRERGMRVIRRLGLESGSVPSLNALSQVPSVHWTSVFSSFVECSYSFKAVASIKWDNVYWEAAL